MAEKFAAGLTYREIGEALFIAPSTVRTHLAAIYEKLGVRNKVALAAHVNRAAGVDVPSLLPDTRPVLAVFPIECLNSEERWRRFADGLSSDITIDLGRYADLPVIAFHTMKSLGSKPADFAADGKALGATYILSGQLRADDTRIRLTIELADARNGVSLWSERYDRPVEDIFALQDSLTETVINVLAGCFGAIATIGRNAVRRKPPASLRAYDLYLLGVEQHNTFSRAGNAEAIRLFSRALELDPTLVRAWTELAYAYSIEAGNCFGRDPRGSIEKWRAAVENAIRLDPYAAAPATALAISWDASATSTRPSAPTNESTVRLQPRRHAGAAFRQQGTGRRRSGRGNPADGARHAPQSARSALVFRHVWPRPVLRWQAPGSHRRIAQKHTGFSQCADVPGFGARGGG
ncbi:adenylate cyclase [Mesorhizobium amorphae CCBAU 01583]|nr:adenylate cyclase [Mesorhizobium amorphae CCBAU 01583]